MQSRKEKMGKLEILFQKILDYTDDGDLMSALIHFQTEVRPVVETFDTYENQKFLDILKEQCTLVDNESWSEVMINIEKLREIINKSQ
jgi:hypothetical protein